MEKKNIIITDFGDIWLRENNLLHISFKSNARIGRKEVDCLMRIIKDLNTNANRPILLDMRNTARLSVDARLQLMGAALKKSMAVLVASPWKKFSALMNILLRRPAMPVRAFLTEKAALSWVSRDHSYPHQTKRA